MTRTFIAIDLSDEARRYLHQQIEQLARSLPRVRWTDPETLHLTLAFLGELDAAQLDSAIKAALEIARTTHPFMVRVGALGMFGPPQHPRVIWIGLAGDLQPLLGLQARLANRLAQDGFAPDERAYAPHLTLARLKNPLSPPELAILRQKLMPVVSAGQRSSQPSAQPTPGDHIHPAIPVTHLSAMKSELTRAGAQYTRLEHCPFAD